MADEHRLQADLQTNWFSTYLASAPFQKHQLPDLANFCAWTINKNLINQAGTPLPATTVPCHHCLSLIVPSSLPCQLDFLLFLPLVSLQFVNASSRQDFTSVTYPSRTMSTGCAMAVQTVLWSDLFNLVATLESIYPPHHLTTVLLTWLPSQLLFRSTATITG